MIITAAVTVAAVAVVIVVINNIMTVINIQGGPAKVRIIYINTFLMVSFECIGKIQ